LSLPKRCAVAAGLAVLLSGCVSTSDIEGLQARLSEIQRQVLQLQQQMSSKDEVQELGAQISTQTQSLLKSEADVQVGLEQLSSQIDQLRADLGDTNYRLSQLSQQITATNQELQAVRTAVGGSGGLGVAVAGPTDAPEDPQSAYQAAYNDYLRGSYDLAILGFRRYLKAFPETDLADNASYWIGECYFSQRKYEQAVSEFDNILRQYPRSDKVASALLKKGYAYLELGDRASAVAQLQRVIADYPQSDEANLARQRLNELGG
jgi:tol-pal system protein YbgF